MKLNLIFFNLYFLLNIHKSIVDDGSDLIGFNENANRKDKFRSSQNCYLNSTYLAKFLINGFQLSNKYFVYTIMCMCKCTRTGFHFLNLKFYNMESVH